MGGVQGEGGGGTHRNTHTHTGTYTRMLHLRFSDLPLKKCPTFSSFSACYKDLQGIWCANPWVFFSQMFGREDQILGGRFGYFLFFCSGRGESEAPGGAGRFFIENPTRGVGFSRRGRGREGVCGELGHFFFWGGGGLNIFFGGPETSTKNIN